MGCPFSYLAAGVIYFFLVPTILVGMKIFIYVDNGNIVLSIARLFLKSRDSSARPNSFVLRGQNKGTKQKATPAP